MLRLTYFHEPTDCILGETLPPTSLHDPQDVNTVASARAEQSPVLSRLAKERLAEQLGAGETLRVFIVHYNFLCERV